MKAIIERKRKGERDRQRKRDFDKKNNGEGWFCSSSFLIILNVLNSKREREAEARIESRKV